MTSEAPNGARCPWCSAALAERASAACPSCGASLKQAADEIPGLTRIDPEVLVRRNARPSRSRLLGWLGADAEPETSAGPAGSLIGSDVRASLEPPSAAVRREMRRLELAALEAELGVAEDDVQGGPVDVQDDAGNSDVAADSHERSPGGASADTAGDSATGEARSTAPSPSRNRRRGSKPRA